MWRTLAFACFFLPALSLRTQQGGEHNSSALPLWHDDDYWEDDPSFPAMSLLEATRGKPKYETDFRKEPRSRVIVMPEHKLALCYIEKNACTQFNRLFNLLNFRGRIGDFDWWHSTMMNFKLDWKDVSHEKGWKWAVFLRDPLPRYLSSWGSKCVQREDDGNCLPDGKTSPQGLVEDFEAQVAANLRNISGREANPHWAPQQDFCGGLKNGTGYDFVGLLRGDVHGQVKAMLEMVNASTAELEQFFPEHGKKGHKSSLQPERYYRSAEVQRMVMEMYKEDFALPGLAPHLIEAQA